MFTKYVFTSFILMSLVGFTSDYEIEQEDIIAFPVDPIYVKEYQFAQYIERPHPVEITPNFAWPVKNNIITSNFGWRNSPCISCSSYHEGIDFALERGTPVFAAIDGLVTRVEHKGGYGHHIFITHIVRVNGVEKEWTTIYAHLQRDSAVVVPGQIVKAGEMIGRVGNTGTSTGYHLHFEIIENEKSIDPEPILINFVNR